MHQAYQIHPILKQGVHIESIAAYDNNVILGTRSGQLIMYSVDVNGAVDMLMFNKNFSKKAIVQMEVVAVENLLIVLSDAMIHVCDISRMENNFTFIHSSQLTKGCSLFTLNIKPTKTSTGETATVIKVCCAIKRRLQFFYWKTNYLESPKFSIELKDVPKSVCWVNDLICVGYKDEYVMFNIKYKTEKHDLIVTSSSYSVDPCICLLKENILGLSKDEFLVAVDCDKYADRKDDKMKAQLASLDATMTKAKNVFKPLAWSSPLLDLVWDEPFLVGRVASGIEVRYLEANNKDTLVQSMPELSKTRYLVRSGSGTIFAAALSELWCIRLVDISAQRQQLLQQKKYQLAIEVTKISDEPESSKAETIRLIHMRYAKELFALKEFSAAMTEFELAQANPYDVIRLFPNLLPDQINKVGKDSFDATVPQVTIPQLEDKDLENALLALIEFLALARQKEVVKLRDTKSTSKSLLSIIDTTLLKCYLQTNDSLIAPLLRLNQCHLEESEKTLLKHDKISELIILYQNNGKHKKALELLQSQATKVGSNLYGYERTIRYLQQLGASHWPLIMDFSEWVLKASPKDGLKIFTENFIEVENLPRAPVLDFLLSRHKPLVIPYLEHVINQWKDPNTIIHNVLIQQYKEKIQNLTNDLDKETASQPATKHEMENELKLYRSKLYNMLENSENYSPDVVLKDFPTTSLLEERALILGRLKKHEKVLAIYIQVLGDVEKACKYCESNYDEEPNIFFILTKIILNPLDQPPYEGVVMHNDFKKPNEDVAVELLNKYATKIDPAKLWPYLPDEMPVERLSYYLDTVLRSQTAHNHHMEMKRALLIAEIQRCTELVHEQQCKSFEINETTQCAECRKRFANQSAFVRYPNGELVHLSCHDKRAMAVNLFGN